jgi:exopolyphosphatase/guanosine-5'-triphosphate,3'-diphosphate pyrophosphatase
MPLVKVAVVDIGSNTARLLVADVDGGKVSQTRRERHYLRLGDDVYVLGRVGRAKLEETREVARRFARLARKGGAERIETIVTAPGRHAANGDELRAVLAEATKAPVVQLGGDDEGRLAWEGAVARMKRPRGAVAVIDLGGGSCELAVGVPGSGPGWVRSLDTGALRVTREHLGSLVSTPEQVLSAGHAVRCALDTLDPPETSTTLAVGGTARAIGRIVGARFGVRELDAFTETLRRVPPESLVTAYGVTPERAATLLGGTLVLAELAYRLGAMLEVGRGGLREGAALMLAQPARAAAA